MFLGGKCFLNDLSDSSRQLLLTDFGFQHLIIMFNGEAVYRFGNLPSMLVLFRVSKHLKRFAGATEIAGLLMECWPNPSRMVLLKLFSWKASTNFSTRIPFFGLASTVAFLIAAELKCNGFLC